MQPRHITFAVCPARVWARLGTHSIVILVPSTHTHTHTHTAHGSHGSGLTGLIAHTAPWLTQHTLLTVTRCTAHRAALQLYPLPTALVIADPEAPSFSLNYMGCCVMNPGAIVEGRRGDKGDGVIGEAHCNTQKMINNFSVFYSGFSAGLVS